MMLIILIFSLVLGLSNIWIIHKNIEIDDICISKELCKLFINRWVAYSLFLSIFIGSIFTFLYLRHGLSFNYFKDLTFTYILINISIFDILTMNVYTKHTLIGVTFGLIFILLAFLNGGAALYYFKGALIGGLIMGLLFILTNSIGAGDIEVAAMVGLFVGSDSIIKVLEGSFTIAGIVAVLMMIIKRKTKFYIPFVPFISLASIVFIIIK